MSDRRLESGTEVNSGALGRKLVARMPEITLERIGKIGLENAQLNLPLLSKGGTLRELRAAPIGRGDRAIVVAAGPSLHRTDVAGKLGRSRFEGAIIATDSAMRYCLRHGIVPDVVVTLDPHRKRIVRWFGDPQLTRADLDEDDYFSRQDMDRAFADEMRANEEVLELLDKYGKEIRLALSTSASPAVVNRALDIGMSIFWWNPMYDDPDAPNSVTRALYDLNALPCMNAGGNVGAACWMIADAVLEKRHVALTGMDLSYYDGTPYRSTQYYHEAVDLVGEENLDSIYMRVHNPYLDQWFFTDPAYMWYREVMLEMVSEASCMTYNCSEGGILFGEGIRFLPLSEFLTP